MDECESISENKLNLTKEDEDRLKKMPFSDKVNFTKDDRNLNHYTKTLNKWRTTIKNITDKCQK